MKEQTLTREEGSAGGVRMGGKVMLWVQQV